MAVRKTSKKKYLSLIAILMVAILFAQIHVTTAYAKESTFYINGDAYEFEEDSHYEFSSATADAGAEVPGEFFITGDISEAEANNGVPSYSLKSGNVSLFYSFDQQFLAASEEEWHITDDKSKIVDDINLDKNILKGTLILQTSLDGQSWTEDLVKTNLFTENTNLSEALYTTKYVQQQNGCYFRVIIAYEMEIKTGSHKVALVTVDDMEYKKCAQVYEFYLFDGSSSEAAASADDTPRKELGNKINTGKDNGYSGNEAIDKDDPHYGWDIGTFVINGYTRETSDGDTPVFLKNVGDKVTLWFRLSQNIDALNGDSTLTISDDTNGYDRDLEVPQTNFKRGTLIVRYTNEQGVSEDPVIYTNYLAANTRTGADTKVILFEEGDYEVSLDYEIKSNPRQVASVSVLPTYTNYKISFKFSIRNGNCMVYPFDSVTGAELSNNAITANGFMLDMARSRYLTIDVTRSVLKENADGTLTEDVRFNRPAKDGETYTDEGIYTFTVNNLYTGESTTKTVYVGTNKYLTVLSKSGLSLSELNGMIAEGVEIGVDGSVSIPATPSPAPAMEPSEEPATEDAAEVPEAGETASAEAAAIVPEEPEDTEALSELTETTVEDESEAPEEQGGSVPPVMFVVTVLVVVAAVAFAIVKKSKKTPVTAGAREEGKNK